MYILDSIYIIFRVNSTPQIERRQRHAFHGVDRLYPGTSTILNDWLPGSGRIKLTAPPDDETMTGVPVRPVLAAAILIAGALGAAAQGLVGLEKQILPMTKANWVAFRDYDGRQFVYFTHLIVYRCGLSAIRYSLNDDTLAEKFPLPPCDPDNPNTVDPETYPPYIVGPLGSVESIAVQVIYTDGERSSVLNFTPCTGAGEAACAALVE